MKKAVTNSVKVIAATGVAALSGNPAVVVATAIGESLSIAMDAFSDVSHKRALELFNSPELAQRVITEIEKSDDFASLVFSLWRRYNYESSEKRRKMLKSILEKATYEEVRNYENFSKVMLVAEQITNSELIVLEAFYRPDSYQFSDTGTNTTDDFQLNVYELQRLFSDKKIALPEGEELSEALTQLGNYGLVTERPATIGGPYYKPRRFGRLFLDYVRD